MPKHDDAEIRGKHVSQPLVPEVEEPESPASLNEPVAAGAWKPVVSSPSQGGKSGYVDYSRDSSNYAAARKKGVSGSRIALIVLIVALLGVLGFGGYQIFKNAYKDSVNQQLQGAKSSDVSDSELQTANQVLTPTTARDPFYMLILGSDSRNDGEAERSDTNIVARVDPQKGIVSMISIPRDTAIMLDGYGTQKFNAAFAYEGIPGAIKAAEGLLGIKISHYAKIDFDGLIALVDALGGVTVDVPVRIDDPDAGPVVVEAGTQHLNGEEALTFARSRAYATGDFQRTTNQRTLIAAILNQCMELTVADLPGVIEGAAKCVTTDMTVNMIEDYALYFMNFEKITVYSVMVPSSVVMNNAISYVMCDTGMLLQVMHAIDRGEDPTPYVNDYTVHSSKEAQEVGMGDAIGVDSSLYEGTYDDYYNYDYGYGYDANPYYNPDYVDPNTITGADAVGGDGSAEGAEAYVDPSAADGTGTDNGADAGVDAGLADGVDAAGGGDPAEGAEGNVDPGAGGTEGVDAASNGDAGAEGDYAGEADMAAAGAADTAEAGEGEAMAAMAAEEPVADAA